MSLVRVLRTSSVSLTHTFKVDEVPTDAASGVTVELRRLDGTLIASAAATHPGPPGQYAYTVPAQAQLDTLTLDWSGLVGGATITARDFIEVVGGFLFDLDEARAAHKLDVNTYPSSVLADKRTFIEQEAEAIGRRAFVPRFRRIQLTVTSLGCELVTPDLFLRAVRAISINGTAMSAGELASIVPTAAGVLYRPGGYWPAGAWGAFPGVVVAEYEYGPDMAPLYVRDAGILRLRSVLGTTKSQIPDRATSFTVIDGGVYRLSTPGAYTTGIPDVDAAYQRDSYDGPV
jgi:hypothetical protein